MEGVNNKPDAIYANFVAVSNSVYEMRIEFLVESPEQDQRLKEVADLRLSPQMAKQLCEILKKSIANYEEKIGVIPAMNDESGE